MKLIQKRKLDNHDFLNSSKQKRILKFLNQNLKNEFKENRSSQVNTIRRRSIDPRSAQNQEKKRHFFPEQNNFTLTLTKKENTLVPVSKHFKSLKKNKYKIPKRSFSKYMIRTKIKNLITSYEKKVHNEQQYFIRQQTKKKNHIRNFIRSKKKKSKLHDLKAKNKLYILIKRKIKEQEPQEKAKRIKPKKKSIFVLDNSKFSKRINKGFWGVF